MEIHLEDLGKLLNERLTQNITKKEEKRKGKERKEKERKGKSWPSQPTSQHTTTAGCYI